MPGLALNKMIRRTMSRWLSEIKDDSRTHLQVATCTTFSLFDVMPDIWSSSVICLSKVQGVAPEILHMALVSNLSYMDHNETKLRVKGPLEQHSINSDVAVCIGNTVSSKKSYLENTCKNLVNNHPENLNKKLSQASVGNGTIKGIRTALEKVKYAAVVSSEPTHTIRTPYLEEPDGCQLLPRTMLNTWTQGEDDESGTGNGITHIKEYKFKCLLIGQLNVAEYICRPRSRVSRSGCQWCIFLGTS